MAFKGRSASFSDGTALPFKELVGRRRSQTVSSTGDGYVSSQTLRSRLHMPGNVAKVLGARVVQYEDKDGLRLRLQHWLDLPMLVNDEHLAKLISIEQSTESSPVLSNGSVAYFRSWPMEASQLSQIVTKLEEAGYENMDYVREHVWTNKEKRKEHERSTYITGTSEQAVAKSWIRGHSLLAICGQEPPLNSIEDGTQILSGVNATSGLLRSILTSMASSETGSSNTSIKPLEDLISFNQLQNWPGMDSDQRRRSRELFNLWLRLIKPLVVVVFGNQVYAWLCQPSRPLSPPDSFLRQVGVPTTVAIPGSECPTIIIPHLHPGSYARNPTTASHDKLFWYPWVATWVFIDTAIRLLSQDETLRHSRPKLLIELELEASTTLGQAGYFKSLEAAKFEFATERDVDTLAIMTCKKLGHIESTNISQACNKFIVSDDRKKVLDLYLSHAVTSEIVLRSDTTVGAVNSKKRSRDHFEADLHLEQDSRANLKSSNWGPSDNTLDRWRRVHNFIQNHDCSQSAPKLREKVVMYKQFFAVAASVHKFTGGLMVGDTPFHAAHDPQWDHNWHGFYNEFLKCVKTFQNAVIQSYIKRLPSFLLEQRWTEPINASNDQRASTRGDNRLDIQQELESFILPSLFAIASKVVHPPYRYKLALERCGLTKGLPDSAIRLEQAEALFADGTASLCGWASGKVAWIDFFQSLEQDVWIAASMEAQSPNEPQLERQKFVETFGGPGAISRTGDNIALEKASLQRASQSFMVIQSDWLAGCTRGKSGSTPSVGLNHIDGHNVEVSQRGLVRLRYTSVDDLEITTEIKLGPSIAPLEKDDKRTVHFTEFGIDLRTPTGFTLRVPAYNSTCTLPLSVMGSRESGQGFVSLWKTIRGNGVSVVASLNPSEASAAEFSEYPEALRASPIGDKGEKPPNKSPETTQSPNRNDALWLLEKYIDLRLPRGGDFWTGSKDDFPQGTGDAAGFVEFVKLPEYCRHPYARWWYQLLVLRPKAQLRWGLWLLCLRKGKIWHANSPSSATKQGTYRKKCVVVTLASVWAEPHHVNFLYGGTKPWDNSLWTASDDRVRGGSSISHLTVSSPTQAIYHGHLDTKTLGGAGFASQRTKGDLALDLSHTAGLQLVLGAGSSDHKFTLNVKDTIPGKRTDGRDEAGVSWEVDFEAPREGGVLLKTWDEFKATYRGRDVEDPKPLKVEDVKRISLMTRSFFDKQDGDFKLVVNSIAAVKKCNDDSEDEEDLKTPTLEAKPSTRPAWKALFCGLL
ncbi:hypothetical protein FGRMN_8649 [Fusarium graminum]|nr:hypothetical protein FGRMN_8649 [Fusarium graminum]